MKRKPVQTCTGFLLSDALSRRSGAMKPQTAFVEAVGAMFVGAIRITAGLLLSLLGLGVFLFVIAGVIGLLLIGIRAL